MLLSEDVANSRTRQYLHCTSTHPHTKGYFCRVQVTQSARHVHHLVFTKQTKVFSTPNVHLSVVCANLLKIMLVNWKQSTSYHWSSKDTYNTAWHKMTYVTHHDTEWHTITQNDTPWCRVTHHDTHDTLSHRVTQSDIIWHTMTQQQYYLIGSPSDELCDLSWVVSRSHLKCSFQSNPETQQNGK